MDTHTIGGRPFPSITAQVRRSGVFIQASFAHVNTDGRPSRRRRGNTIVAARNKIISNIINDYNNKAH